MKTLLVNGLAACHNREEIPHVYHEVSIRSLRKERQESYETEMLSIKISRRTIS